MKSSVRNRAAGGSWAGKRVAVLSPTPTSPQNFGNRRSFFNFFRQIRERGARVSFLHYPAEFDWRGHLPTSDQRAMQEQWDDYFLIPPTRELHGAPAGYYHEIDEWWDPAIGSFLDWYFRVSPCDVFIVNYTWLTRALLHSPPGAVKILHTHDQFSGRRELLEANGISPEFFYVDEPTEREALRRADVVWAVKEEEEEFFAKLSGRPSYTFPHVEQRKHLFTARRTPGEQVTFGFMGARNSINATNYQRFFETLKRYLIGSHLPADFVVAGSLCDKISLHDLPFLTSLGPVSDVLEFYRACDVVVVPMSFSSGLKIKIGEAAGYGKAVIGYRHAFEGYLQCHKYHTLESDKEICEAIAGIVNNPGIISQLEEASLNIQLDAERRASYCLSVSLPPGGGVSEQIVLPIQSKHLERDLLVDHVCDVAQFIGYQSRSAIAILGDIKNVSKDNISRLVDVARCYVDPQELAKLSPTLQEWFRERVTAMPEASMLSGQDKIVYAVDLEGIPADWLRQARAVIHREGIALHGDGSANGVVNTLKPEQYISIRSFGAAPEGDSFAYEVPYLRQPWHSAGFRSLAGNRRGGTCLILSDESALADLHNVLDRFVPASTLERCTVYLPKTRRLRHRSFVVREARDSFAVLDCWSEDCLNPGSVFDLSGDKRFALLAGLSQLLGIPYASLSSARPKMLSYDFERRDNAAALALRNLLESLLFDDTSEAAARRARRENPFARENGWSALWRLIERLLARRPAAR